jgi:heme-degrading monooxygenase HmoA
MSFIRTEDGYLTLFNIFHTENPEGQQRLIDQWRSLPPANTQPGLVSGNFHVSLDGRSVINYAQWESQAAYDAFIAETATRARLNESLSFSRMDNLVCEVVHTWSPVLEISLQDARFTVVIVLATDPQNQDEVLKEMINDDPGLADVPGYVSHAVHRGLSGEHVIKYAQWQSEASLHAFLQRLHEPSRTDTLATAELYFSRLEYIRGRL